MATQKTGSGQDFGEPPVIHTVRGEQVILDSDVARFLGVPTSARNQVVKRNERRFADDFAFRLTAPEVADLKSQNVISSADSSRTSVARLSASTDLCSATAPNGAP